MLSLLSRGGGGGETIFCGQNYIYIYGHLGFSDKFERGIELEGERERQILDWNEPALLKIAPSLTQDCSQSEH